MLVTKKMEYKKHCPKDNNFYYKTVCGVEEATEYWKHENTKVTAVDW